MADGETIVTLRPEGHSFSSPATSGNSTTARLRATFGGGGWFPEVTAGEENGRQA